MNESLLLFESKWKSFLKESQDIDVDALADEILNGQRMHSSGFYPQRQKKETKAFRNPIKNKILLHNLELLYQNFKQEGYIKELYKNKAFSETPLEWTKLEKKLGCGTNACAYLTENNKVLKFGNFRTLKDDDFFKKMVQSRHPDFQVYFYKRLEPKYPNTFILLTNYLMPFKEYVNTYKDKHVEVISWPGPYNRLVVTSEELIQKNNNVTSEQLYNSLGNHYERLVSEFVKYFTSFFSMSEGECEKLLKVVLENLCEGYDDLHLGNLGVNLDNGPENPSFFFFDV